MSTKITVRTDGSIRVSGDFELFDKEGNKFDLAGRTRIALCRCGQSKDKPFCDSTHKQIGFRSEIRARVLLPETPRPTTLVQGTKNEPGMKLNHMHVGVRELPAAVSWIERVWGIKPSYNNERMAVFASGSFSLIIDSSDDDSFATVGFASANCDLDYKRVMENGAVGLEEPKDRPWGSRAAYVRGPGQLKFEIEQSLGN